MLKPSSTYPKRGEIFTADLNPGLGYEVHKKRPIVVISNNTLNRTFQTIIIVPCSSIVPNFIGVDVIELTNQKGLSKKSVILTSQIRSIDKSRLGKKIGSISAEKLEEVEYALKIVLGLEPLE